MKEISAEQVQKHNSEDKGIWIVIDGSVYDVTKFQNHPGSFEKLLRYAGRDATKPFNDVHHSKSALELSKKFLIGQLKKTDLNFEYEQPNKYVESNVPNYYYILPILIGIICFYFIFVNTIS